MESSIHQQTALSLKHTCVSFLFAYQQKNISRMMELCDRDGTIEFIPLGEEGKGKIHELGKLIWTGLIDSFPDLDNTLDAAVAEDDWTVRCQVVIRGTQQKDFAGIPNKGGSFDSDHIFVFRINNHNLIESITIDWDHAGFQRQLGKK